MSDFGRHPDGTAKGLGRRGWAVDVFEAGVPVRQAIIVSQTFNGERVLYDAEGRSYVPRTFGLGVEEVELPDE